MKKIPINAIAIRGGQIAKTISSHYYKDGDSNLQRTDGFGCTSILEIYEKENGKNRYKQG